MNLRQALTNPLPGYVPLTEFPRGHAAQIIPGGLPSTPQQGSAIRLWLPPSWATSPASIINGSRAQASAGQTAA